MFDSQAIEAELLALAPPGLIGYFTTALEGRISAALSAAYAAALEDAAGAMCDRCAAGNVPTPQQFPGFARPFFYHGSALCDADPLWAIRSSHEKQ